MTAALILLSLFACSDPPPPPAAPPKPAVVTVDPGLLKAFGSPSNPMLAAGAAAPTGAQVDLGRLLYYEKRLSKNQDVSCNTCHLLNKYGVDGTPTSTGHKAQKGGRNAPTVYNAAGHIAQFWDGRAADVEAQAKGPVLNPIEMAMADEKSVVAVLETIPEYTLLFQAAFPGEEKPVTYDNMAKAIGAFERGLVTPSPFDRLLAGDQTALTDAQKAGLTTFVQSGCTTCHSGPLLGGGMYQKLGLVTPWPNPSDAGRFDVTKNEADKQLFKVPSLRNIEETGPYFHDGSVATLDEAIRLMGHHQLGRELSPEQVGSIQTFLGSLTGELPTAYIAEPPALASGPKTPKPDPS